MIYIEDVPVYVVNDVYLFENNIDYIWAKVLQASKISKRLMDIFFSNSDLAPMQ